MSLWLFAYGSLIWRPDLAFDARERARLPGYERRFWQGSHDHRGVPDAPGRVVTLVPVPGGYCDGIAYRIPAAAVDDVLPALDHREKNGYERRTVQLTPLDRTGAPFEALTYVGQADNFAWLGDAATTTIAAQIASARGPSGANVDYLLELARALRAERFEDAHVFALEQALAAHVAEGERSAR